VKAQFGNASVVGGNRVVFNIAGSRYRLVVKFNYSKRLGFVRFIGTHAEYDRIDAEKI
jgi:mRNA interferase HigB